MQKAAGVIFLFSWLLGGCSVDQIFDDWRSCVIFVIALAVTVLAAGVIAMGKDK